MGVEESWPSRVAAVLGWPPPNVIATTSWTCRELLKGIESAGPKGPRDAVTVQVGVNDQYRGHPLGEFAGDYAAVLAEAVRLAGSPGRVTAISIPDWSVTPHAADRDREAVAADIDRFNEASRRAAVDLGAAWVDVTASSRLAAGDPSLLAADGLHPSGAMYRVWAGLLAPAIRQAAG